MEVLLAATIMVLVLLPMLDFSAYMFSGQSYQRQLAITLAASKLEEAANVAYRTGTGGPLNGFPPSMSDYDYVDIGNHWYGWKRTVSNPFPISQKERSYARRIEVEVFCWSCKDQSSVRVVSYIGKIHYSSTTEKSD